MPPRKCYIHRDVNFNPFYTTSLPFFLLLLLRVTVLPPNMTYAPMSRVPATRQVFTHTLDSNIFLRGEGKGCLGTVGVKKSTTTKTTISD